MHPIFAITTEDIRSLTDEQSRELIARLCRAELSKNSISQAAVTWGGDQRAKDGGVDVRIDVDPPLGIGGYIKRDRSAFQVKAEKFGPGKISDEMAPKGLLRPAIVELANDNGAYVIVSTRDSVSEVAKLLNTKQANVSKIERRTDLYISTLRDVVSAMGGKLQIIASFPDGDVQINQFDDLKNEPVGTCNHLLKA